MVKDDQNCNLKRTTHLPAFNQQERKHSFNSNYDSDSHDNSGRTEAENDTHLTGDLSFSNLLLTTTSSSSSDFTGQEDSQSSNQSQPSQSQSQSQKFNDMQEYNRIYQNTKNTVITGLKKRRKLTLTGSDGPKTKKYNQRSPNSNSVSPDNPIAGSKKRKNKRILAQLNEYTPVTSRTRSSIKSNKRSISSTSSAYSKSQSPLTTDSQIPAEVFETATSTPKQIDPQDSLQDHI